MKKATTPVIEGIPYQDLFDRWKGAEKWAARLVWVAGVLSVTSAFWHFLPAQAQAVHPHLEILNRVIITLGVAAAWYAGIFAGPRAEVERVGGFIDNAFETTILEKAMDNEYYTNDGVEKGVKRMTANCFENCLFTNSISAKMTPKIVCKNFVFFVLFVVLAVINLNVANITALFQLLISSVLLEKLIKHLYFRHTIDGLFQRFTQLYDTVPQDDKRFQAHATYVLVRYEKALSYYNQSLDSSIYKASNPSLSKEWEETKIRYNI
jgi:hypothetical protein